MSKLNVSIVDYGLGNLYNVERAFQFLGAQTTITGDPTSILKSDRIVLPGVGAFGEGMKNLKQGQLLSILQEVKEKEKPILGICLGMQLLLTGSEENGAHKGLNFIPGQVVRFQQPTNGGSPIKIPQISWNTIDYPRSFDKKGWDDCLLRGLDTGTYFYFVHSYYVKVENPEYCIAETNYGGISYASVVQKDNIMGCQFHPERSGKFGLKLLHNFLEL